MNNRLLFFKAGLVALSCGLLLACQPWDLPTRKTQRQCTTPGGQFTPTVTQLQVAFTIGQPTGTYDRVEWDFGDTKTQTTTGLTNTYIYAAPGTYTVKATMANLCGQTTTLTQTVTVTNAVSPTVTTQPATDATTSSVKVPLVITRNGNAAITKYGICYSKTNSTPTVQDNVAFISADLAINTPVFLLITGLEPNAVYYGRAFAYNAAATTPGYGETRSFQATVAPVMLLSGTPAIGQTNASVGFTVSNAGYPAITQYGIVYSSTNSLPGIENSPFVEANNPLVGVSTIVNLPNLAAGTTYPYRPFARTNGTITYGPTGTFTTVSAQNITRDLVLNIPFESRSLQDLSGFSNNGITVGSPTFTTDHKGRANSAILLNGQTDYFYAPDAASLRPDSITLSLWVRVNSTANNMTLYNKSRFSDSGGEQYSSLIKPAGNGITINTDIKQGSNCTIAKNWQTFPVTSNIPLVNIWRHIVFTYEKRTARMYLDGVLISEKNDLPADKIDDCIGGELKFGAQFSGGPQYFNGAMDDIRVYRRALTSAEVKALTDL